MTPSRKENRMNIYVGNLSYDTNDDSLRRAFEAHGQVASATVVMDRYSGRSRGFGFVEMPTQSEALAAISSLNETELDGRTIRVNEARPREDRRGGGRRGDRRGGGRRRDDY
jgi:RNA recognition motif-containing protein